MLGYQKEQTSLSRKQKQAISLLSIGNFLEYFDLMLYVHMGLYYLIKYFSLLIILIQ